MNSQSSDPQTHVGMNRRSFLATTGASALAFTVLKPELVRGSAANSKIDVGVIGCGGRGRWIAELFQKHGGYNVVAAFDYFQDRTDELGRKLPIAADKRYHGLYGYRKLLEQKVDAVVIKSPPYFHPEQAAEAVAAGKHVYCAKPVAVDVPGCVSIAESGRKASAAKLAFLVDFQTRANAAYQDAAAKVHAGDIGKLISIEAAYQCSIMFENLDRDLRRAPNDPEVKLRAWAIDRTLSGDVITEQNIHSLDVACWMANASPIKAYGTGGRRRPFLGDCWDYFACIFYFPNDVIVSFNSRQAGFGYDDILCRVYGLDGTVDTHYAGKVTVRSRDLRIDGDSGNLYLDGTVANIASFHNQIVRGDFSNPTVEPSVRSNLTTILGRMAAYQNREVTWDQMMRANEKFVFDTKGLKD